MGDLPSWAREWSMRALGAKPVELVLAVNATSDVRAVRLEDDRIVVLKARPAAEVRRASRCVQIQRFLAEQGFPCARPVTGVSVAEGMAVHAEEWLPGGELERGRGTEEAARSARLLAELMELLEPVEGDPPTPSPEWVRWDHGGPGLFPPNPRHDALAAKTALPHVVEDTARRSRRRLRRAKLRRVIGHGDWEAQNLRWNGPAPHAVHDWDSLAWQPEAALVGAAAGAFASADVPTLVPVESSAAFLHAYAAARGRAFDDEELEIAWAASLWPALHNARGEVIYSQPSVALAALEQQAHERLELANA